MMSYQTVSACASLTALRVPLRGKAGCVAMADGGSDAPNGRTGRAPLPRHKAQSQNPLFAFDPEVGAQDFPLSRARPRRKAAKSKRAAQRKLPVMRRSSFTTSLDTAAAENDSAEASGGGKLMSSSLTLGVTPLSIISSSSGVA